MDTFNVDKNGHLVNFEEHEEYDEVVIDLGEGKNKSWRKEYGSIKSHSSNINASGIEYTVMEACKDEKEKTLDVFKLTNL